MVFAYRRSSQPAVETKTTGTALAGSALAILFLVALFNNIDRALISILQVPIKRDLGLSDAQLGGLTGFAFTIVHATAALPMGRLVDRYSRTWLLAGALTFWTLLTAASGLATNYATLVICRFGVAFGEACSYPAAYSLLADYFPLRRRGRAFSVFASASFIGVLIGVFTGGWLSAEIGWKQSFIYVGLAGLLIVPLLVWLPEPRRGQQEENQAASTAGHSIPPLRVAFGSLFGIPAFRMLVVGMTLQSFVTATYMNWAAPFLSRVHHLPIKEVGLWTALPIGIGGGIGALASGIAIDKLTRRNRGWYGWASAIAAAVLVVVGTAQVLVGPTHLSIAISFLTGVLTSFYVAPSFAAAQTMVSPTMRGGAVAMLLFIPSMVGTGMGPLLTGVLSDYLGRAYGMGDEGLRYALMIAFLPALGAALAFYLMGRALSADGTK